ncbi:MAG: sulfur carrier protein ThiS [Alphaproteobacteria bacterium]
MNIILNGNALTLDKTINIHDFLSHEGYDGKLVAVALNGVFVPKSNYSEQLINENDKVEIVAPMQGG